MELARNSERNLEVFEVLQNASPPFEKKRIVMALLDLNGISRAEVRELSGQAESTVNLTLNNLRRNPRVRAATSRLLGILARELFDGQA